MTKNMSPMTVMKVNLSMMQPNEGRINGDMIQINMEKSKKIAWWPMH